MSKMKYTARGFSRMDFKDNHNQKCSIQKSSSAMKHCIWLGVNDPEIKVMIPYRGWKDVPIPEDALVSGRMHLTQDDVKMLLPYLIRFAETGELE